MSEVKLDVLVGKKKLSIIVNRVFNIDVWKFMNSFHGENKEILSAIEKIAPEGTVVCNGVGKVRNAIVVMDKEDRNIFLPRDANIPMGLFIGSKGANINLFQEEVGLGNISIKTDMLNK